MFYLSYLRNELLRRKGRTILTALGLALGVALVIVINALSRGLDDAQQTALNPLASIGTDLTVTVAPQEDSSGFGGNRTDVELSRSVTTDLSKLGKPGEHFVHDFFLSGTQLTFPEKQVKKVASLSGVSAIANGLTLTAVHQEGIVPKIVAQYKTGGDKIQIDRQMKPPTAAELAKMQACLKKAGVTFGAGQTGQDGQSAPQSGFGNQQSGTGKQQSGTGNQPSAGGPENNAAFRKCMPASMRRFRGSVTTPQETLRQVVNPPQTNISSEPYTIGGVDPGKSDIGIVTETQVTQGRFLSSNGGREALVSATYAKSNKLKVGSKLNLNGAKYKIVGFVQPPLGGQTADVYLPLKELQRLAKKAGLANVLLVRATSSSAVSSVKKAIEKALPGSEVASSAQVADSISGSLVDASNLSQRLGLLLSILAAAVAFLIAVLLTLSSVAKRIRELGTLKALGWTQRLVVRQIVGESLAQGLIGGLIGIALGAAAAAVVNASGSTLSASATSAGLAVSGVGTIAARTTTSDIALRAPLTLSLLLLGIGLALAGGLIAGAIGALRAARIEPADTLRRVE
jgi:putative ABC transport system permease protein